MTHPFYAVCIQIKEEGDHFIDQYLEKNFSSFFSNFSDYLKQFQKQVKTSIFSKSPIKTIKTVLDSVQHIIERSNESLYHDDMIPDLTNCFTVVLHPKNSQEIRTHGVKMFYVLTNVLGANAQKYTLGFSRLVFDFSPLEDQCIPRVKLELPIDINKRIQINDNIKKTPENLIEHLDFIFNSVLSLQDNQKFIMWWNIILTNVIGVSYKIVSEQLGLPNSEFGISSQVPWILQSKIVFFLSRIFERKDLFLSIISEKYTTEYLAAILQQCANGNVDKKEAFNFVVSFINATCSDPRLLKELQPYIGNLLPHSITCLLTILDYSFNSKGKGGTSGSMAEHESRIDVCTRCLMVVFKVFFEYYGDNERRALCSQLANWTGADNSDCTLHLATLLLSMCVNQQVSNPIFWNEIVHGGGKRRSIYLGACAYFASYYAVCISDVLLSFKPKLLKVGVNSVQAKAEWLPDHGMWLEEFESARRSLPEFFHTHCDQLTPPGILANQSIRNIRRQQLVTSEWSRETCLANVRTFIDAFRWWEAEEQSIQTAMFTVGSAFIYPLMQLTRRFPDSVNFDHAFLLGEFMDWLKRCVMPGQENGEITLTALRLLGDLVCAPSAVHLLDDKALADFYLTLMHHAKSDVPAIKQAAVAYGCRAVTVGLQGAHILASTIASSCECLSLDLPNGVKFGPQEIVTAMVAVCRASDISPESEESRVNNKRAAIAMLESVSSTLRLTAIVDIVIEEALAKRDEVIDRALSIILGSLKDRTIDDVYALSPLLLVLPELEEARPGSIERLLNGLLDALDARGKDDVVYEHTATFTADLLIYSAHLVDTTPFYQHFEALLNGWQLLKESCPFNVQTQRNLHNTAMYLASNYLRYPFPSPEFVRGGDMENCAAFRSASNILRVQNHRLVSDTPVGRYAWSFKAVCPPAAPRALSDDVNNQERLPEPSECPTQQSFAKHIEGFIDELYSKELTALGIKGHLCDAGEFHTDGAPMLSEAPQPKYNAQFVPPSGCGRTAPAFLTSMNFFDLVEGERLYPALGEDVTDSIPSIDTNEFRHTIHAFFVTQKSNAHFDDFKNGLGFVNEHGDTVYTDCRHSIVFHADPAQRCEVCIVWMDSISSQDVHKTFYKEAAVRIEIGARETGLFTVRVLFRRDIPSDILQLREAVVTKRALPVYVIAQVLTNVHLSNAHRRTVVDPFLAARTQIENVQARSFAKNSYTLACTKKLLRSVGQD